MQDRDQGLSLVKTALGCSYAGQGPGAVTGEDSTEPSRFYKMQEIF